MARVLIFPNAIEHARGRYCFARMAWQRWQGSEVKAEDYPLYLATKEAYVEAWLHFRAITRL